MLNLSGAGKPAAFSLSLSLSLLLPLFHTKKLFKTGLFSVGQAAYLEASQPITMITILLEAHQGANAILAGSRVTTRKHRETMGLDQSMKIPFSTAFLIFP